MNQLKRASSSLFLPIVLAACGVSAMPGCGTGSRSTKPELIEPVDDSQAIAEASALSREAQRYENAKKPDEAIARYRQALATYRDIPGAWHNLARLLMNKGENLQAAEAFKTAAELSPTDPRPLAGLGALWEKLGYLEDASKWYGQALQRDPSHLESLRRHVLIDQQLDRVDSNSFERVRRALLVEQDPWWIERLKRAEIRFRQVDLASRSTSSPSSAQNPIKSVVPRTVIPAAHPGSPDVSPAK